MDPHRWLSRFLIGSGVEKSFKDTSHHNEAFQWYRIPDDKLGDLETNMIDAALMKTPFTLSEHMKEKCRLFLDLDVNKGDGEVFGEEHLLSFLSKFVPFVEKENRADRFYSDKFLAPQIGLPSDGMSFILLSLFLSLTFPRFSEMVSPR